MKIVVVSDVYPPLRSSGAVQLRDLSIEFSRQGHEITMLVASPSLQTSWVMEELEGVQVLRLRAPATRDMGYVRRTIGELLMPFVMLWNLQRSPLKSVCWDALVWYSPTIFLGPLVGFLKRKSRCRSYLIIRDIFPEWALDMGLLREGIVYQFFKAVARYQYSVADVIGVQTAGNAVYFDGWLKKGCCRRVEVLHNWLADRPIKECSIQIKQTMLQGRKIFVYAGNMGVAQGIDALLKLAAAMQQRADVGFVFVGRGTEFERIQMTIQDRNLSNTILFDEIDPDEIPALYAQCHVGMVALDPRHKTHNIPGKFLSYMLAGLPVLACVNEGNDLIELINAHEVGVVIDGEIDDGRLDQALTLAQDAESKKRCKGLAANMFSSGNAVQQIVSALQVYSKR